MVHSITHSRSARRLVQTCALAVLPLLFGACTAAVPGVPASSAPIALATPSKTASTKPPATKGLTLKGGVAAGTVGAKMGTSASSNTGANTAKTGTSPASSTGAKTSSTGTSAATKTGTSAYSNTGAKTSSTGTSAASNTGANTAKTGTSAASSAGANSAQAAGTAAGDLVMLHPNGAHGNMLTDAKGMTLYVFDKDSKDKSACTGDCLTKWPPLTVANAGAMMKAGAGITGKLGTIKRDDGKLQVTINGMPLYYYYQDKQAGDAKGQAAGNVWWEVGADGSKLSK